MTMETRLLSTWRSLNSYLQGQPLKTAICRDSLSRQLKLDKEKVQSPYPVTFSPLEGWYSKRRLLFGPFLEGKSLDRDLHRC